MSKFILVTGMHRSGTSALTGFLRDNGVFMGNVDKSNKFNLKGNVEQKIVNDVNEKVLRGAGGAWMNPRTQVKWNPFLIQVKNSIISSINKNDLYGIKDPRFVFTYEEWLRNISDYQIIASFRSPLSVAKSLQHRNGFPLEIGLDLWKRYNLQLLQLSIAHNIYFVHYSNNIQSYKTKLQKLHHSLELKTPINFEFFDATISKNSIDDLKLNVGDEINNIYKALIKKSKTSV